MKKLDKEFFRALIPQGRKGKLAMALWFIVAAALLASCFMLGTLTDNSSGRLFPVYISEVLAGNTAYPNADGRCCDFIEIYNSADYPFDLSGYQLGDIAGGSRYAFPQGTIINPDSYYVVYCDELVEEPSYAPFAISRSGGESFYLIASNNAIVDSMTTIASDINRSMVLSEDGQWVLTDAVTPARANSATAEEARDIYNSGLSPLRITEFSAANSAYAGEYGLRCDWVELYNTAEEAIDISGFVLTDNIGNDKFLFPAGTTLSAHEYMVVYCSDKTQSPDVAPFGLSLKGGESLVLKNAQGMIIEMLECPATEGGSISLSSDGKWAATVEISPGYDNSAEGHRAYLEATGAVEGAVIISEVMAAAQTLLLDAHGAFSDWVEIYNTTDKTIDLSGWYLSDDEAEPLKWEFPKAELKAGEYLIVHCSGGVSAENEIHADFSLSANGEKLILSSSSGVQVDAVSFEKSETNCSYIYPEAIMVDYPSPGYENTMAGHEAFCGGSKPTAKLAIWEVMSANTLYLPQALGQCYDWVELKNVSDETIDLSEYSLSEDTDGRNRYVLPQKTLRPGEFAIVILSGDTSLSGNYPHADFALNGGEAELYLFHGEALCDGVHLKDIPVDHSYGRNTETGGFGYMSPTPTRENAEFWRKISAMPTSSAYAPGVYTSDSGFEVPLEAAGAIYYTLDGSDPTSSDMLYTAPITITETAVLRAISVEEGKMPGDIYTASFIIGADHELPVISLVTDPANLWGVNGIYKSGDITIKEERRSANLAFSGEDGAFSIGCEISLHGATTVTAFDKKSFTVRFKDNYDGPLNFDLFRDGEVTTFSSLIVRTAHESTYSTQMRDTLMGYVASQVSDTMLSQKFRYAALYINGEYWGLYSFREHHSPEHYASYIDVPADTVHSVRFCVDEDNSLHDLYKKADFYGLRSAEDFEYASSVLDMSSYIDWVIFEAYVGNVDIHGNMRYYYSTADNLWRCGLVDVDLGMFSRAAFDETADSFSHGVLVSALLKNKQFQYMMAERLAELLAGPMSDEAMIANIDYIADIIRSETVNEGNRWGCPPSTWEILVDQMRSYCRGRAEKMVSSFCSETWFSAEEKEEYFGELIRSWEGG